ncbi:MAG TPA: Holliday junction resolvase RuvX [Candidatus Saccharimonadales bacterium]|jgi:putative Holliday junction resolvase|nr:Holliday junction resolvase RuvX [Candidatus Saccharimonadales bacterium]
MSATNPRFLGLDVGERRIGVAYCDGIVTIAVPLTTLIVDGTERIRLHELLGQKSITDVIIGRPRNQSGQSTAQTASVERMADQLLHGADVARHWQDESLTSVAAEERLQASGQPYQKEDIDMHAATIILQDFLEANHGH